MITKKFEPSMERFSWNGDTLELNVAVVTDRTSHYVIQRRRFDTLEIKSLYPENGREYTDYQKRLVENLCEHYAPIAKDLVNRWLEDHLFVNTRQSKIDVKMDITPEGKVTYFYIRDWNK